MAYAWLLSPLGWLMRPLAIPAVGAAGGLFYGSYDLTLSTFGSVVGTKSAGQCSITHKMSTFLGGLTVSGCALYARLKFNPPPPIPKINMALIEGKNYFFQLFRHSVHSVKTFPVVWYASSIAASGVITGVTVSLTR